MTRLSGRDEIPAVRLRAFCQEFSRKHQGWLTSLSVVDTGQIDGDSLQSEKAVCFPKGDMVLHEVRVEGKEEDVRIALVMGDRDKPLIHRSENPGRVLFEEASDGEPTSLRIDDDSGSTTLLRFRAAESPPNLES